MSCESVALALATLFTCGYKINIISSSEGEFF